MLKQDINTIPVLNPKEKMTYFKKHWSPELQDDVVACLEEVVRHASLSFSFFSGLICVSQFKERYLLLSGGSTTTQLAQPKTDKKLNVLLRELSDDEENTDVGAGVPEDPKRPWLTEFRRYLDIVEQVPDGCSAIAWWGVSVSILITLRQSKNDTTFQLNAQRYHPAWSSLARDYLAIMSSSVSSERAFSQGGITISKLRSCLKGDIVEALQCIKCAIRTDLLFPVPAPSSVVEAEANDDGEGTLRENEDGEESDVDEEGWGDLLLEDEDGEPVAQMDTDSD
jgi:hAT family C-terminal dimerisation region